MPSIGRCFLTLRHNDPLPPSSDTMSVTSRTRTRYTVSHHGDSESCIRFKLDASKGDAGETET